MRSSRRARTAVLALLSIAGASAFAAPTAAAQGPLQRVGTDLKHVGEDVLNVWTSPVRGSARDWLGLVVVGAGFAAVMPFDDAADRWAARNDTAGRFDFLKEFRSGGSAYKGATLVPVALAVYVAGVAFDKQDLRDGIMGCVASYVSQSYPRKAIYFLVGRERPSVANGDQYRWNLPGDPGNKDESQKPGGWYDNSFPGGHFANLMTCASFLNHRFKMGAVEPVLYVLAAGVGVGRLADRGHWLSDQLAGGVLGYAAGRTVAIRQLKREEARRARQVQTPAATTGAMREGLYIDPSADRITVGWAKTF